MHALVLAAGLGTRLRPLTDTRAKPALPVAGDPIIRRIVGWLAANSVTDVVVNLHHLPHTITAVLGDGSDLGVRVRYSWEQPRILGSAGGPRQALDIIGADTFALVNGDTLTDLKLNGLAAGHAGSGARVTLALVPNREPEKYGGAMLDDGGAVTGFVGRGAAARGSFHFIGAQIVQADVFRGVPAGEPAASIGGLYDDLIARQPGSVRGVVADAAFWDIGTPEDYARTSEAFEKGVGSLFRAGDPKKTPDPFSRL
jgi:NDP-sugar pyrophosphorylase family protein